jgi:hypothetical protein
LRTAVAASLAVTLWLEGNSVATALLAAWLGGCTIGDGAGAPTGLMLKSVLMAASWCRSQSQIPTRVRGQLCQSAFNAKLENAMNRALTATRDLD